MTTKLEMKVEEGITFVKVRGQSGWGRPVIDDEGRFYRNLRVAAEALNVSQSTVSNALDDDQTVKGHVLHYASEEETAQNVQAINEEPVSAAPAAPKIKMVRTEVPFTGVKWPDGTVTVRLSAGGLWSMSRQSMSELPEEVRFSCSWVGE